MNRYLLLFQKISGIGYKTILKMIEFFGSLENAFIASEKGLREFGFKDSLVDSILENKKKFDFDLELEKYGKNNIKMVSIFDDDYPRRLKNISDPPTMIFYKGNLFDNDKLIGVVGSRRATEYGVSVTRDFCDYFISNNIISVSGGAIGIDSIAHERYVDKNYRTIAVMGCGLENLYPYSNKNLFENILSNNGLIVSEFPIGVRPIAKNFVMRNRIISGLSDSVFIVEAGLNSGTMTTAGFAIEQNKNVFVVPGSIYSEYSQGTNKLIKDGAIFITDPVEIDEMVWGVNELTFKGREFRKRKIEIKENKVIDVSWMSDDQKSILECILYKPINIESITSIVNLNISFVSSTLILFEIKGLIKNVGGMNYVRN